MVLPALPLFVDHKQIFLIAEITENKLLTHDTLSGAVIRATQKFNTVWFRTLSPRQSHATLLLR